MNKKDLRQYYKALRREIAHKAQKSDSILHSLLNRTQWRTAHTVALYASLPDEVDTAAMITSALDSGKCVCLPKVHGGEMQFYAIHADTAFHYGAYGIREPEGTSAVPKEEIELIIVPLLAADKDNYRLGFGGGYYDKYLKDFTGVSIGVCFQEQLSPFPLPHEAHDIALDDIIYDTA
ncbi:MAG: 5-formyltetrahydrofolate cyclo-ligase [Clostridia bacterium]|nr:5-formyltetrahydrofolate cyclo-ligase [Clostridia bacterium]